MNQVLRMSVLAVCVTCVTLLFGVGSFSHDSGASLLPRDQLDRLMGGGCANSKAGSENCPKDGCGPEVCSKVGTLCGKSITTSTRPNCAKTTGYNCTCTTTSVNCGKKYYSALPAGGVCDLQACGISGSGCGGNLQTTESSACPG